MLKRKIDKAAYDALPDAVKAEYKEVGSDFLLDVERDEDNQALKNAKDHEKRRADTAEARVTELEGTVGELTNKAATADSNVAAVEKRYKDKEKKTADDNAALLAKKDGQLSEVLVMNEARAIAAEISNAPEVILPHILARLKADLESDTPTTVVLDADGQPTKATIEQFKKEMVANKKFAAIIIGSKGSGSGASPTNGGGGAPSGKKLADCNDAERAAWAKADLAGFNAAVAEDQQKARKF